MHPINANKSSASRPADSASRKRAVDPLTDPLGSGPLGGDLPDSLQASMESMSGMDLSDVRVNRNSSKPAQLGAEAYAEGSDIHLGPGQGPHLPHEAWHVVQQKQGRVAPGPQFKGSSINADAGLEAEADRMGAQAESGKMGTATELSQQQGAPVVQRALSPDYKEGLQLANAVNGLLLANAVAIPGPLSSSASGLKGSKVSSISKLATVIAGGNAKTLTDAKRRVQLQSQVNGILSREPQFRAEALEGAEGGHSLDRHGPDLTDQELKTRLDTGIAADGAFSPTPGASTKFNSYQHYLDTRVAVTSALKAAFKATRGDLKGDLKAYYTAKSDFNKAPPGPAKAGGQPLQLAIQAARDNITATVADIGADDAARAPVKFNPNAASSADWIVSYQAYKIGMDHGGAIGGGFEGQAGSKVVVTKPGDPTKTGDGWTVHDDMCDISKSFSTLTCANDTPVFPGLDPTDWPFVQHFPSDTTVGFRV